MGSFFAGKCPHCGRIIQQRNEGQNGAFHALCTELDRQLDWPRGSGLKIGAVPWKRLLVCAWERTHGRPADIYPALDGHGFDMVYRRTSRMTRQEMSELIEFAHAWAAEQGVVTHQPEPT